MWEIGIWIRYLRLIVVYRPGASVCDDIVPLHWVQLRSCRYDLYEPVSPVGILELAADVHGVSGELGRGIAGAVIAVPAVISQELERFQNIVASGREYVIDELSCAVHPVVGGYLERHFDDACPRQLQHVVRTMVDVLYTVGAVINVDVVVIPG